MEKTDNDLLQTVKNFFKSDDGVGTDGESGDGDNKEIEELKKQIELQNKNIDELKKMLATPSASASQAPESTKQTTLSSNDDDLKKQFEELQEKLIAQEKASELTTKVSAITKKLAEKKVSVSEDMISILANTEKTEDEIVSIFADNYEELSKNALAEVSKKLGGKVIFSEGQKSESIGEQLAKAKNEQTEADAPNPWLEGGK